MGSNLYFIWEKYRLALAIRLQKMKLLGNIQSYFHFRNTKLYSNTRIYKCLMFICRHKTPWKPNPIPVLWRNTGHSLPVWKFYLILCCGCVVSFVVSCIFTLDLQMVVCLDRLWNLWGGLGWQVWGCRDGARGLDASSASSLSSLCFLTCKGTASSFCPNHRPSNPLVPLWGSKEHSPDHQ